MMATTGLYPSAVHAMANHVAGCLKAHRARLPTPLFVGVQGPQGSGKTFLTSRLRSLLADSPYSLSVTVLSIDDLYLPHVGLVALARAYPRNRLLHGRGQPGTHDVALGHAVLTALKALDFGGVTLPVFDKSLFDGAGDRVAESQEVHGPVDVVVLEGWCVGFYPLQKAEVEAQWARGVRELREFDLQRLATLEDVLEVNALLGAYVVWWETLDAFIQLSGPPSSPLSIIYRWRLQQEQEMKAKNGGRGMTDEQVKTFVDRYIPGYVFFGDGVREGPADERGERSTPPWHGRGIVLELDLERQLVRTSQF